LRPLDDVVLGVGLRGHLGLSSLPLAAAVRAKVLEPRDTPFVDARGRPAAMAAASCVDPSLVGAPRYLELGAPALREAAASSARAADPLPLLLVLPEAARPDAADLELGALLDGLEARSGVRLDRAHSRIVARGHAGGALALKEAFWQSARDGRDRLVGAIDAAWHPETLRWLDARGRLCTEDDDRGRTPSEAAAFLLVGQRPRRQGAARITAVEHEVASDADDERRSGVRLGRLVRRVAGASEHGPIQWVVPDLNGELERQRRWLEFVDEARDELVHAMLDELVPHTGDVGAATTVYLVGACLSLARMGAVPIHNGVVLAQSDDGAVGVVAFDVPSPSGFRACIGAAHVHRVTKAPGSLKPTPAERRQLDWLARTLLEDVGSMGMLLAPEPLEGEASPEQLGQRLLDAFDAFAALGLGGRGVPSHPDLLGALERYVGEVVPSDKARRFARAFVTAHLDVVAPGKRLRRT
jgi:YD repeat-containing protein